VFFSGVYQLKTPFYFSKPVLLHLFLNQEVKIILYLEIQIGIPESNHPTPDNVVLALVYRIEYENYADIIDLDKDKCDIIPPEVYQMLDGWIRESLSEFLNKVLSLPLGSERDEAKRVLKQRMESLIDKHLKRTLYSVCRSLRILN